MTSKRDAQQMRTLDTAGLLRPVRSNAPDAVAERKRQALVHFEAGMSVRQAADAMGLNRWALYNWIKTDASFRQQKEQIAVLRDMALSDEMEDHALDLARGKTSKDNIPYFPAIKHMLQVTDPKRHGDKREVSHSGTVVHTMIPTARRLDALPLASDIIDVPLPDDTE